MKKNKLITGIVASGIVFIGLFILVVTLNGLDGGYEKVEKRSLSKVEYTDESTKNDNNGDSMAQTSSNGLENDLKLSEIGSSNKKDADDRGKNSVSPSEQIVLESGSTDGFTISLEQAAEIVWKEAQKIPSYESNQAITFTANSASKVKYYQATMNLSNSKRLELQINGVTGEVIDLKLYEADDVNSTVWTLLSTNSSMIEKKIHEYDIDSFSKIDLSLEGKVDVEVVLGKVFAVNGTFYGQQQELTYANENGKLAINYDTTDKNITKSGTLTITVPENTNLEKLEIANDCGEVQVIGIKSNDTTVSVATGNVHFKDVNMNDVSISLAVGDITMENADLYRFNLGIATGDVNLNLVGEPRDYSYDITVSIGKIVVDDVSHMIAYKAKNSGERKISIGSAIGDIDITFLK